MSEKYFFLFKPFRKLEHSKTCAVMSRLRFSEREIITTTTKIVSLVIPDDNNVKKKLKS